MPPPPQEFRIAGAASRAASASSSVPSSNAPIKIDRDRHSAYDLPPTPATHAKGAEGSKRSWPQRPHNPQQLQQRISSVAAHADGPDLDDDEEEEGAIDDITPPDSAQDQDRKRETPSPAIFRPPPPKTPPHSSSVDESRDGPRRSSAGHHADNRRRDLDPHSGSRRDRQQPYQPRSPPPQSSKNQSAAAQGATTSAAYYPRSPSPPPDRRSSREYDNATHWASEQQQHRHRPDRSEHDIYRPIGNGAAARYPEPSTRDRDRGREDYFEAARGWDPRWRDERGGWDRDRDRDRRGGDRGWDREMDRRSDRADRDHWRDHARHRDQHRDRVYDRNGRDRELSPPTAGMQQPYAGWSPTPPPVKLAADVTQNGEPTHRPPSRMGRAEAPPPLSRPEQHHAPMTEKNEQGSKRSNSPSGGRESPPAGLLKRKPNFNAVVPPVLPPSTPPRAAPGAPLPPKVNSLESPVLASRPGSESTAALPGSQTSSALPTSIAPSTSTSTAAIPAEANFTATCDALDDVDCPSVRLSCLPRKPSNAPSLSGRERRKAQPPRVPLNQRKFHGCSSLDDYEISIKLGQGTFGEVLKGRHILTGTQVALKKVTIHDAKDGLPITALREIKLLKKLKHPSIVPVIDMAYRPSGERGKLGDVYMVEPYMDHDLNGMLENPSIRLEHSQIKLYMKQLLEGTLYLHKNRILHRDMKAANLLINNMGQLQIADFGLARPYRDPGQSWTGKNGNTWNGGTHRYTNMVVTRWYRPPELLAGEKKYGPPIDMWGIGCILAEMVMGKPLFKGTSEINQLEQIAALCGSPNETNFPGWSLLPGVKDADPSGRPDPHPDVPGQHEFGNHPRKVKEHFRNVYDAGPGCADLIDKLLVLDPRKRLTAREALAHEWFWSKPYPADPASLPKYEHSKEIDRVRREWKPAPVPAPVPAPAPVPGPGPAAAAVPVGVTVGGGMMGSRPMLQHQHPYSAQAQTQAALSQPPLQQARGGGYTRNMYPSQPQPAPSAVAMGIPNPVDSGMTGYGHTQAQPYAYPPPVPSYPQPNGSTAPSRRHPFPHQPQPRPDYPAPHHQANGSYPRPHRPPLPNHSLPNPPPNQPTGSAPPNPYSM